MTDKKCKYDGSNQHVKNWNEYDDKSESPPFKLGQEYIMANRPNLDDEKERERWKNMYHISDFFNIPDGPRKNPNLTCDYETATKDISDGLSSNQSKISVSTWKSKSKIE
ncbi:hypothetical protein RF11_07222 [Thelohanellus kitauei]|uniref:Uncharacterized protein n=1 Tax=Thelohanellus kitauei TaxID=669202 RepID=A0A0C2N1B3_THEKT|nr:hypothetical protein RF11_07222 [Thelohanellus kitauei]